MATNAPARRAVRRTIGILVTIALVAGMLAVATPNSSAKENTCRARNVTQGSTRSSDLQAVIEAASPGDVIAVKFVCVGNFRIDKELTLVGRSTPRVPRPVLHANGVGRVLVVNARATLENLKITGGDASPDWGGGIWNTATLVLKDTLVRRNTAISGGGIWNQGVLILNGSSSVRDNTTISVGGGVNNTSTRGSTLSLTLNDSSSVSGNNGGGIYGRYAIITLNDSSSVSENNNGSGIFNQFGSVALYGFSSVSWNTSFVGGGIHSHNGTVILNDWSSVSGNSAATYGGGIYAIRHVSVTMNDASSVTGNTADADDNNDGVGGGIYRDCTTFITGALYGVDDNYLGTAAPVENNIVVESC